MLQVHGPRVRVVARQLALRGTAASKCVCERETPALLPIALRDARPRALRHGRPRKPAARRMLRRAARMTAELPMRQRPTVAGTWIGWSNDLCVPKEGLEAETRQRERERERPEYMY